MKRSGQHALINWIARQSKNTVIHKNNCIHGWENKQFKPMVGRKQKFEKGTKQIDYIVNIEDFDIRDFKHHRFSSFNFFNACKIIILARDPYNWIASCYKRKWEKGDYRDVYEALNRDYVNDRKDLKPCRLYLWKLQLQECLKKSDFIDLPFIDINYNKWFTNKQYRKKIASALGLQFTDAGIDAVCNFGKGSSFDGRNFDSKASKMKVLDRWKEFENDTEYKSYFDDEIFDISKQYFDMDILCSF
jgi:hypothetical protein